MAPRTGFPGAGRFVPADANLDSLRAAASGCEGCDLYRNATQTVFGEGDGHALVMLVGEQPGDREDVEGHPFVGPAGRLLDRALHEAGIDRGRVYITNAVKHFKYEPRGKRRIHKKPSAGEVTACRPWLEAEIAAVRPRIIVCLGATAAQALLGAAFRVSRERGRVVARGDGRSIVATVHPSSILRAPDDETRDLEFARFVADLLVVAETART
ncbi:MAG: UdgX family uracil-DNA binding protein [Candidatus Dormibacteraeota bacterium]|nr:UdgX family uracil-DNA binding protein [Candidatus Dormibacteraeota bacterium]MBV9525875.1 UdgX family uracil-DNA binding protein [Candidatus Dormibacteraeota bacterium]